MLMQFSMVFAAEGQGHGELIAHFSSEGSRLSDLEVVCIAWTDLTHEAWLRAYKGEVRLPAFTERLGERRDPFILRCRRFFPPWGVSCFDSETAASAPRSSSEPACTFAR
jgi:hypothetical protein